MDAKIIKVNSCNYFYDADTFEVQDRYDPEKNLNFTCTINGSVVNIMKEEIHFDEGTIFFDHDSNHYVVDDGYRNTMIRAGYLVYQDYDERFSDKKEGKDLRRSIRAALVSLLGLGNPYIVYQFEITDMVPIENDGFEVYIESDICFYTVVFDTVTGVVAKNQKRKEKGLSFFPFLKNMDKNGTLYVSIFMQNKTVKELKEDIPKINPDQFIDALIEGLGEDYKYVPIKLSKKSARITK